MSALFLRIDCLTIPKPDSAQYVQNEAKNIDRQKYEWNWCDGKSERASESELKLEVAKKRTLIEMAYQREYMDG